LRNTSVDLLLAKETVATVKTANTALSKQATAILKENAALKVESLNWEKAAEAKWVSK
jgi:hypothetical protein